jgi:hypothetical protein
MSDTAPAPIRLTLSAQEAAAAIGVSERSFRRGLAMGRIPRGCRLGGRMLWPIDGMRAWVRLGMPSGVSLEEALAKVEAQA